MDDFLRLLNKKKKKKTVLWMWGEGNHFLQKRSKNKRNIQRFLFIFRICEKMNFKVGILKLLKYKYCHNPFFFFERKIIFMNSTQNGIKLLLLHDFGCPLQKITGFTSHPDPRNVFLQSNLCEKSFFSRNLGLRWRETCLKKVHIYSYKLYDLYIYLSYLYKKYRINESMLWFKNSNTFYWICCY